MDLEYDIFEVRPNGDLIWRVCTSGLDKTHLKLAELAKQTSNPLFAIHTPTNEIVARVNHDPATNMPS